jgi:hypothetical protein
MLVRGAPLIVPIALIAVFFTRASPVRDIGIGVVVFSLAVSGGALAGLSYSAVGQYLRRLPVAGPYLAGIVTAAPYMVVVGLIVRVIDAEPLDVHPDSTEFVAMGLLSCIFGAALGHMWFRDEAA